MTIRSFLYVCLLAATFSACGTDPSSTRPPIAMAFDTAVGERARGAGNAQDGDFGVIIEWALAQHGGTLLFTTPEGQTPASVSGVAVRLSMPAHGHDGLYPQVGVQPHPGESDAFDLDHLYPSMPGDWQVEVRATVDGTPGKAILTINFSNETVQRFSRLTHDDTHHCH